jgi:hypothetical protein
VGKGGTKTQVTEYYMSQHFGVCVEADAFKSIIIKEKEAWSGYVTEKSKVLIQKDELFGGATKEGGATGTIYFLPGRSDQLLYDELANRLKTGATGADVPGYRGIASVFFTGRPDANKGAKGFYWSANNPYLPGVWVEVERAPVGLTPGYAMIPRPGVDPYPIVSGSSTTTARRAIFSRDYSLLYMLDPDEFGGNPTGGNFEVWDMATRTKIATFPTSAGVAPGIDADGTLYSVNFAIDQGLVAISGDGVETILTTDFDTSPGVLVVYAGGLICVTSSVSTFLDRCYYDGVKVAKITGDFHATFYAEDLDGNCWAMGSVPSTDEVGFAQMPGGSALLVDTSAIGTSGDAYAMMNADGMWLVHQSSKLFLVDPASWTVSGSATAASGDAQLAFRNVRPGASTIWIGNKEYDCSDGTLLNTIDVSLWDTGHSYSDYLYDPINGNLVGDRATGGIDWFIYAGVLDANPAHIIYECLRNTDWGMGSPTTLVDTTSFEDAGVTLFNEPLGISLLWTRQTTIQDFVQEILNHCNGVVFVDPQTGLLTMKLIRGDYDPDTLPAIDPSTANLTNFGRKLWGDIPNEMNVTWTNPTNENEETVTEQDLGSITTQGGIVSDSRNYYGVRYADLAKRLARRELRSAGAPLATMEAELDRSYYFLRPASVLKVNWPEYGLSEIVCRVTTIDYGKPGDAVIKVSLIEDVFGLDIGDYTSPPSTAWEDTSQAPDALDQQATLTLPYYFAANGVETLDGASYPEVLAGAFGASDNPDAHEFELWGEVTLPDSSTEWRWLATLNVTAYGELSADLDAEASSTAVSFDNFVGGLTPDVGGFAIIGSGDETENEIALVTAAGYSLSRGILDTVPKAWAAGTPVWFFDADTLLEDPTTRSAAEVVDYKLRTRTSEGLLSLAAAPLLAATLTERPWLPSRPAKVMIGGVMFNDLATPVDMIGESVIPVTWANRNRLSEDTTVLSWTDATVTPETGQTTTLTVYKTDLATVLGSHTGLTGTSFDIPVASFGTEAVGHVVATASRTDADGTFESLQGIGIYVQVDVTIPVGTASETDAALALTRAVGMSVGRANETDTALALTASVASGTAMFGFAHDGATFPSYGPATWPAGIYVSATGTTWIARESYFGNTRLSRVSSYVHGTGTWTDSGVVFLGLVDDDHGVPALFRDADGYIHAFGGAHESALRHSVTRSPDDNSWWTAKAAVGTTYSYPHPVFDGTNLYLFLRDTVSGHHGTGVLLKSTAISTGNITFAAKVTLVDFGTDSRFYLGNTHDDGTYIHLIVTRSPADDSYRQDIYHFRYKKSDGSVVNADGTRSTASGSLPIGITDANTYYRIVDQSTASHFGNIPTFCADTSGNLQLIYKDGASGTGSSWDLKHMTYSGGAWGSASTVVSLSNGNRYDMQSIGPLSSGSLELLYPDDDGTYARGGIAMKRIVYSGGSWGSPTSIATNVNGKALDVPGRIFNAHTDLRHHFYEIDQDSLNSSAGGLVGYIYGAGGVPARTIPSNPDGFTWLQLDFTDKANGTVSIDSEGLFYKTMTAVGNAQVTSAKLELDGTGDYLTNADDNIWSLLNYEFTFDALGIVFDENARNQTILSHYSSADRGWFWDYDGVGHLRFIGNNGTNTVAQVSWTPTIGPRYDLGVVRSGNTIIFYDGVNQIGTAQTFAITIRNSGVPLNIGRLEGSTTVDLNGRMERLRMRVQTADYTGSTRTIPSW